MSPGLSAPHVMAFAYRRGVGGAESRFLSGLRAGVIRGTRAADGRVLVPPLDHDPATGAPLGDWVTVADLGVVRSWTWVTEPGRGQPLDRPFAFALVRLDGADTALLHVVDVPDEGSMATGMRVRADWRLERVGSITDIRAFVPAGSGDAATIPPRTTTTPVRSRSTPRTRWRIATSRASSPPGSSSRSGDAGSWAAAASRAVTPMCRRGLGARCARPGR